MLKTTYLCLLICLLAMTTHAQSKKQLIEQLKQLKQAKLMADQNAKKAMKVKDIAEVARQQAKDLRLEALAQVVAMRSSVVTDPTLQSLLACQAYNLYQKTAKRNLQNTWIYGALSKIKQQNERLNQSNVPKEKEAVKLIVPTYNNYAYATGASKVIYKVDIRNGGKMTPAATNKFISSSLSLDPAQSTLACAGAAKYIKLYNVDKSGKLTPKSEIKTKYKQVSQVIMTGRDELYTSAEGELAHWKQQNNQWVKTIIKKSQSIFTMGVHQKKIAWSTTNKNLSYQDKAKGVATELKVVADNDLIKVIKFSPDGRWLAAGTANGHLYLWRLTGKQPELVQQPASKHSARIHDIVFGDYDRHGKVRKIATSSWDRSARIYHLNYLNELPLKIELRDWVWSLAFSSDGSKLLLGDRQGKIQWWATTMQGLRDEIASSGKIKRNLSLKEWKTFVAPDLKYERTFADLPNGEGVK